MVFPSIKDPEKEKDFSCRNGHSKGFCSISLHISLHSTKPDERVEKQNKILLIEKTNLLKMEMESFFFLCLRLQSHSIRIEGN